MTDRELMQQALYVFDLFYESGFDREDCFAVIKALRERLAQPEKSIECMCGICKLEPKTAIGTLLSD
jgi:hypothetical protein